MTDSMNIDSDIVESLEELESLDRIPIDYFHKSSHVHEKDIPDLSEILPKDEIIIKSESVDKMEDDEDEDMHDEEENMHDEEENMHEEIHETITAEEDPLGGDEDPLGTQGNSIGTEEDPIGNEMTEETMNAEVDEMIQNVMEVDANEEESVMDHHDSQNLFSEGVIGEEIIEDEQVIQQSAQARIYDEIENISEEQVLEGETKVSFHPDMDEIVDGTVVGEETIIESLVESSGPTQILPEITEEEIDSEKPMKIKTEVEGQQILNKPKLVSQPQQQPQQQQAKHIRHTFLPQVAVRKSEGHGKVVTSNVYVMNPATGTFTAQSLLQGNTILAPKDGKVTRVVLPSNVDATAPAIRIVAPQGKVLGSTAKTITIAQAKQMGIFTQAKINQILPTTSKGGKLMVPSKKTVTVVKSPTKILPAPLVSTAVVPTTTNVAVAGAHKTQKVLIRSNSLKPGTILTTTAHGSATGGQVIRIPTSQALTATTLQLPNAKTVQYVKLVGSGTKSQTFVPVKTVPVALPTSLLNNSQTAFKVVPISTAQGSQQATTTQRVYIPTSAVSQQQAANIGQAQQSIAVMVPSHLIHQVKKDKIIPTVTSVRTTNGKRASTPTVQKQKEPVSPPVSSPSITVNSLASTNSSLNLNISQLQSSSVSNIIKHDIKQEVWSGDEAVLEANGIRPRKPCNCTKSMCLKLYCDCFANGEFCNQCNCTCCSNNLEHEEERQRAIKSCLERNPSAFRPKIGKTYTGSEERRHNKGCNCRRSGCLKNYCECYEAKIPCSKNCKCIGCKNTEGVSGKRGGGSGMESGDDRLKSDSSSMKAIEYRLNSHRQAFSQITDELVEATCQCLVAKADKWDKECKARGSGSNDEDIAQAMIIEEFGRCLDQIIEVVSKSIAKHHPPLSSASSDHR